MPERTELVTAAIELLKAGDDAGAEALMRAPAQAGDVDAQVTLALALQCQGRGRDAERWLLVAVEGGYELAANNLSTLYAVGTADIPADRRQADVWRLKAIAMGFPHAPGEPITERR